MSVPSTKFVKASDLIKLQRFTETDSHSTTSSSSSFPAPAQRDPLASSTGAGVGHDAAHGGFQKASQLKLSHSSSSLSVIPTSSSSSSSTTYTSSSTSAQVHTCLTSAGLQEPPGSVPVCGGFQKASQLPHYATSLYPNSSILDQKESSWMATPYLCSSHKPPSEAYTPPFTSGANTQWRHGPELAVPHGLSPAVSIAISSSRSSPPQASVCPEKRSISVSAESFPAAPLFISSIGSSGPAPSKKRKMLDDASKASHKITYFFDRFIINILLCYSYVWLSL